MAGRLTVLHYTKTEIFHDPAIIATPRVRECAKLKFSKGCLQHTFGMICVSLEEEKYYFCTMISSGPSSLLFRHGENFNIAIVLDIINVDIKLCTRAILVHTTFSDCDHISRSLQHHLVMEVHGCIFWWVFILSSSDFFLLYAWTRSLLPTFAIIDASFFNKNCNIVLEVFLSVVFFLCWLCFREVFQSLHDCYSLCWALPPPMSFHALEIFSQVSKK